MMRLAAKPITLVALNKGKCRKSRTTSNGPEAAANASPADPSFDAMSANRAPSGRINFGVTSVISKHVHRLIVRACAFVSGTVKRKKKRSGENL